MKRGGGKFGKGVKHKVPQLIMLMWRDGEEKENEFMILAH